MPNPAWLNAIRVAVSQETGIPVWHVTGKTNRLKKNVAARNIALYLTKKYCKLSNDRIAELYHYGNGSSVMHSINKVRGILLLAEDQETIELVARIEGRIGKPMRE